MSLSRSTSLLTAWMVVGAFVSGPRTEAASPPTDCVRTTIGPVVVDVPSVRIRPRFRLDGKPFPGAQAGSAVITLWASEPSPLFDGPQLSLGQTHQPPKSVRVVPGVYDVYYSWQSGSRIPRNKLTRILQRVSLQQDGELLVDVQMVRIAGFKLHNGQPFADDGSIARLSLQRADGPGEVPLGGIVPSPFAVRVIPGLYSLRYEWGAGRTIPRNRRATVLQGLSLEQDAAKLALDVPSVPQDFVFLHNGAPFPSSEIERGDMVLTGDGGDEVPLGSTHVPRLPIRIVPGQYDARFRHGAGAGVPRNLDGFVERVRVNGSLRVIDVPSVEVSGAFRVNGAVPPATQIINARINLVVPDSPDRLRARTDAIRRLRDARHPGTIRRRVRARGRSATAPEPARDPVTRLGRHARPQPHDRHPGGSIPRLAALERRAVSRQRYCERRRLRPTARSRRQPVDPDANAV